MLTVLWKERSDKSRSVQEKLSADSFSVSKAGNQCSESIIIKMIRKLPAFQICFADGGQACNQSALADWLQLAGGFEMVKAVVGANWGDEGKGKITDMLGKESDIIVRFQGGANAGHTIVNDYGKFALHTLPSGVFYSHTTSVIGNGVALDIPRLCEEIQSVVDRGVPFPKILVSDRAQIVMSYHKLFDAYEEERLGGKSFGSTKSGIAPFYSDKFAKIGFQVSELYDDALLKEKSARVAEHFH